MLPFLKKKEETSPGLTIKTRTPDKSNENQHDSSYGIEACAQDLITAVHAKDASGVAEAIKSAFIILESEPHEETPHTYEDQKED